MRIGQRSTANDNPVSHIGETGASPTPRRPVPGWVHEPPREIVVTGTDGPCDRSTGGMHTLAINRRFLYVGLFLVALGGVLVAVDLTALDTTVLANALRLWPLAFIAIGAGIVLRRSRYALVAGILAAMIPGLVLGGGLAIAPRHGFDCGSGDETPETTTQRGTFTTAGTVFVETSCSSISIGTQPGNGWQLTSSNPAGRGPDVELDGEQLSIGSTEGDGWDWLDSGRDTWNLTLPTSALEHLAVDVNAGRATLALPDANIGTLVLTGNGAEIVVDATSASIAELDGTVDFGQLSIRLPQRGTYSGAIRIDAGELRLCVPSGLGLHVDFAGSAREVRVNGLETDARVWENEAYASATNRADLSVKVNFGSIAINPIGGCK